MKTSGKARVILAAWISFSMFTVTSISLSGVAVASEMTESGDYLIGAGDLIEIVVWKNPEVSGEFRIRPDGKFSMPLVGDILAEGMTTDLVSMQVEKKLKLFIDAPFISTIVRDTSSNRIYILGEVARPGAYPIDSSLSVLQALAMAGGLTEFADRNKLLLVRGTGKDQEKMTINYTGILKGSADEDNVVLKRGDTLVVP